MDHILEEMRSLLDEHGLHRWNAAIGHSKAWYGLCDYQKQTIFLSSYFLIYANARETRNIILHEIAHALTPNHNHDKVWKAKAIEIGSDGKRCYSFGFEHLMPSNKRSKTIWSFIYYIRFDIMNSSLRQKSLASTYKPRSLLQTLRSSPQA